MNRIVERDVRIIFIETQQTSGHSFLSSSQEKAMNTALYYSSEK